MVANVAQSPDGTWRALDGVPILQTHRLAAGYLYQAHLRSELSRELGAAWTPTRTGQAELANVPSEVVAVFSQRRAQLVEHLEQTGTAGWHAAQAAAVITRARKEPLDLARLTREWRARAAEHGLDRATLNRVFEAPGWHQRSAETIRKITAELVSPDGLTARRTSFTRADAIIAIAERLPDGAPTSRILEFVDTMLASHAVTRLDDATPGRPAPYTTSELIIAEHDLVEAAARIAVTSSRAVQPVVVERIIDGHTRRHGLAPEQAHAVRTLTTAQNSLSVLVGAQAPARPAHSPPSRRRSTTPGTR